MDEHGDHRERTRRLEALTEQFLLLEARDDEARAYAELENEEGGQPVAPACERRPLFTRVRARTRLLPAGVAIVVVIVALVLVALQLRGTSGALAEPNQAAVAAERARTFAFDTLSELRFGKRLSSASTAMGEVDLVGSGGFKVRVQTGPGAGFERVAFPTAVYFRGIGRQGARAWLGAHLSPAATITAHTPSGGGLGDPLALLAILASSHHARFLGQQIVDGQLTRHYTLQLALGAFLPASSRLSAAAKSIPVEIQVWQDRSQRLVRAVRAFDIGGPRDELLTVQTDFTRYGKPTALSAPVDVPLVGSQRLGSTADDPLGASVLSALTFGTEHGATPAGEPASVPVAPGSFRPSAGSRTAH